MTFIPVIAVYVPDNHGDYLLGRAGYRGHDYVLLSRLDTQSKLTYDTAGHDTPCRTIPAAHQYIQQNWTSLKDGAVIDVEFISGETEKPKDSERFR